jgi:hypothetical protein
LKNDFLPVSKSDIEKRGWDYYDFLYIVGDAYVDHPSFGHAIISRVLESRGYRVAILPQPINAYFINYHPILKLFQIML